MLAAFFAQTFSNTVIIADYYANTKAFAQNCENKMRPQMHCNGKCQLQKKIEQEDNKDKQNPERRNDNHNETISSKTFFAQLVLPLNIPLKKQYSYTKTALPADQSFQFFHPPQLFM